MSTRLAVRKGGGGVHSARLGVISSRLTLRILRTARSFPGLVPLLNGVYMNKIPTLLTVFALVLAPCALRADSDTDRKIEESAKASYNYHTILQDKIHVRAKDGAVTLTGTVRDDSQKQLAEDTVTNLPGVTSVDNRLKVSAESAAHSDDWIAFKINTRLLMKANVSASDTHVEVHEGVVTLTGNAKTQAQKDLTEAYAKDVEGVRSVHNDLMVGEKEIPREPAVITRGDTDRVRVTTTVDEPARPTMGDKIDDASITAQIKYELVAHRSTSAMKTKVETHEGIVTISGDASSDAEKDLVSKIAKDVRGVRSVDNVMTVRPGAQ